MTAKPSGDAMAWFRLGRTIGTLEANPEALTAHERALLAEAAELLAPAGDAAPGQAETPPPAQEATSEPTRPAARFPGFQRWSTMPRTMRWAWLTLAACLSGWGAALWLSLPPIH